MKHFLSKVKKCCRNFINGKAAFSLVELIVVIAIMAVMAAVLAPALLGYVEKSRMQKDDSAMDEVVNTMQLSLADQDVYDEMLKYSAEQYSCYVDSDTPDEANKVDIKADKYYMYNDNERQLDETVYKLDGVMRGVTITFAPDAAASNNATLDLIKGHVNKYLPSGQKTYGGLTGANASPQLSAIVDSELYNALRATIGDKIAISSQTYRNSEYTVFISMGTTGGQEAAAQDAIKVWGQWSGTNLPEGSSVATDGANTGTSVGSNEFQGIIALPDKGKTLEEYTWPEVQRIVKAGKATEYGIVVGATKSLTYDNQNYTARIIGLDQDGVNTATFLFTSTIGNHAMNNAHTNRGGFSASEMNSWLNNTAYNLLGADIKSVITPVSKISNLGSENPTGTSTGVYKLFLLSVKEVGLKEESIYYEGYYADSIDDESTFVYTYFQTNGLSRRREISTNGKWWWLRSATKHINSFFLVSFIDVTYSTALEPTAAVPAFVIG